MEMQESRSLMELAEGAALWDGKEKRVAFIFPEVRRVHAVLQKERETMERKA